MFIDALTPLMHMDCSDFLDRYSDYDDSLLSVAELATFQAHLAACPSCARYDRVLRKGRMLARQLPPVHPGHDFVPRLQQRLWRSQHTRRAPSGAPLGGMATALAAVTLVLSAVGVLSLMDQDSPETLAVTAVETMRVFRGLPVTAAGPPRHWSAQRLDHRASAGYSPLVIGPPAYLAGTFPAGAAISTRHTVD
jgi:anti-sigma factor RsiW